MLSEEEKKAIEHLTKKMKYHKDNPLDTYVWLTLDEHYVRIILNLIEKQSKEIEELKDKNKSIVYNYEMVVDKLENSTPNDKIKAKIEELDKEEKKQLKGTKGQDRYAIKQEYMYKRSVLQSLLEKE